jgi:hypothetical protein
MNNFLEHTNLTVRNPSEFANKLCLIFGWKIRWSGDSINDGHTVHVGSDTSYLALYQPPAILNSNALDAAQLNNLNHLGIVVNNLETVEKKVKDLGFEPFDYRDYEFGKRFYFLADDGLEIEVISYS